MVAPGKDVSEMDKQIFDLTNQVRQDPKCFIKHLEEMLGRFEGDLLKNPGKTTLRTKEGPAAVQECIENLKK